MAKYTIRFSCGHQEEKQLFGPYDSRERWIAWAEREGVCSACYRAQKPAGVLSVGSNGGAIEFRIRDCFAIKDSLKERGYRWDGSRKVWTKSFGYDAARKAEIREQLLQEIQGLEALGVQDEDHYGDTLRKLILEGVRHEPQETEED